MDHPIIYYSALVALVYLTPLPILIIFFHKTILVWRRLGTKSYYVFVTAFATGFTVCAFIVWHFKDFILSWRLYDHPVALFGLMPLAMGLVIGSSSIRTLSIKVLLGFPEIDKSQYPSKLVTRGLYRYVRHPRYLEFILEAVGMAILSGLMISILFLIYYIPAVYILTTIEERELVGRFGQPYLVYRKTTGRFFPVF